MISCPACRTLLFSDTIVCPACRHVLDEERAALLGDTDDLAKSRSEQIPCRSCGEANQIGLVRCWNCSAFLREDIQEAYYEMLRAQREVIYSQRGSYSEGAPSESSDQSNRDSYGGSDDDFELSGSYRLTSPEEPASGTSGVYKISGEAPTEPKTSEAAPSADSPATSNGSSSQDSEAKADSPGDMPNQDSQRRPRPSADDPNAEDHSVATGGDVLLDIALKEEAEAEKTRKRREAEIKRRRQKRKQDRAAKPGDADAPSPERLAAQKKALSRRKSAKMRADKTKAEPTFGLWLSDVHLHKLNPQKLKLKPGSEEKQFELVDMGCSSSGVVVASLTKKPGFTLFGKPKSDPAETRKEVRAHLEEGKDVKELPAPEHDFFEGEALGQIKVVQPVVYVHESMFAGVPVFGEGRIAVRLPVKADVNEQRFLSFWLTDFRKFSQALEQMLGIKDLGHLEGVPLTDPILDLSCHYSEAPLTAIDPEVLKFYQADPGITLELIGRRCEGCGLAVSEDARRKEKIGGLKGNAIAKAKCPKCEKKFGSISLFQIAGADKKPAESPADAE